MKVLQTGYQSMPPNNRYYIYVIRLDDSILRLKKFRDANPDYQKGKPCAYVGQTYKQPDIRFKEHISGYRKDGEKRFSTKAKRYGRYLCRKQFKKENEACIYGRKNALKMEAKKAAELRAKGWAVWSK